MSTAIIKHKNEMVKKSLIYQNESQTLTIERKRFWQLKEISQILLENNKDFETII